MLTTELLAGTMLSLLDEYDDVAFVGEYEVVSELLPLIIKLSDDIVVTSLDLNDEYDNVYSLAISNNELFLCKLYDEDRDNYLLEEADVFAVDSKHKHNKPLLDELEGEIYFVNICNGDCENCDESEEDMYKYNPDEKTEDIKLDVDEDMKGFTMSRYDETSHSTYSFYSSDESYVSEMLDIVKKLLK